MASTIFCNYVVRLHHDAAELARFKADPDSRIQLAGLTPEQGSALKSKDPIKIQNALCTEAGVPNTAKPFWDDVQLPPLAKSL